MRRSLASSCLLSCRASRGRAVVRSHNEAQSSRTGPHNGQLFSGKNRMIRSMTEPSSARRPRRCSRARRHRRSSRARRRRATSPPASAIARSRSASSTSAGSKDDPAQSAEVTQTIYDGRRAALEAIIAESLLAEAAKASGLSADGYLEAEIAKRVKPVTDVEVSTFFTANTSQMQGRSLEVMAPAINRYLTDQRRAQARDAILSELRKQGAGDPRGARGAARQRGPWRPSNPSLGERERARSRWSSSRTTSARSASASSRRSSGCAPPTATSSASSGRTSR